MKHLIVTCIAATLIAITGCQRNIDEFSQEVVRLPDAAWVEQADSSAEASRMFENQQPSLLTRELEYNGELELRTEIGDDLELVIPSRSLEYNGAVLLRGNIKIEVLILLRKGEWIRAQMTTAATNGRMLESHGIILARAWYNNVPVTIRPDVALRFRYRYAGADVEMKYFIPGLNTAFIPPYHFAWMPGDMGHVSVVEFPASSNTNPVKAGYMVESKRLGWMAVAKPAKVPERSGIVTVGLPEGFQNRNTHVYLSFTKHKSLLALQPEANSKLWFRRIVPVETPFMVITVTRQDGKFYLGLARTTDSGINGNKHFDILPRPVTLEELLKFLKNLE